jgi:conjugative transfer pilus assembly protein TraH
MKKPITISLITSCLLMSSVNASGIQDWADGVMMTMDSPKSISTRDRTVLYGGGVSIRTPNLTLTPFNVKAPGIKAGCGNIDMVFGSLGFLDADEMVRFAEGILAAAPGVAFDLAMKTLCPSCSETLKALQAMTNQINSMSLDSCQAANAIVGGAFSALSSKQAADVVENSQSNNSFMTE